MTLPTPHSLPTVATSKYVINAADKSTRAISRSLVEEAKNADRRRCVQVEYAIKAVENGGTAIGIRCKDGVVLAVEKLITSKLLKQGANKRISTIDRNMGIVRLIKLPPADSSSITERLSPRRALMSNQLTTSLTGILRSSPRRPPFDPTRPRRDL